MSASESFELPDVDRITAGAIGPPGARVFYLQARRAVDLVTLKLEKEHLVALAQFLAARLADLPPPDAERVPDEDALALEEPVEPAWPVGNLGISYDEVLDRVVLVAEELVASELDERGEPVEIELGGATAQFGATREQVAGLIHQAVRLIAGGRPACPACGRAMDPEGHACVRANGHRSR